MKYTKCPTCGGQAKIVSDNFERAGILISQENEQFKHEYEFISKQLEQACIDLQKKVEHLSSQQLFFLYRDKLQQEILKEEIERDRCSKILMADFQEGLNRMLDFKQYEDIIINEEQ